VNLLTRGWVWGDESCLVDLERMDDG